MKKIIESLIDAVEVGSVEKHSCKDVLSQSLVNRDGRTRGRVMKCLVRSGISRFSKKLSVHAMKSQRFGCVKGMSDKNIIVAFTRDFVTLVCLGTKLSGGRDVNSWHIYKKGQSIERGQH